MAIKLGLDLWRTEPCMSELPQNKELTIPMGVVLQRRPGVTRWAKWAWKTIAVLPGAGRADWAVLRDVDGITEYHVGTYPMELHHTDIDSYRISLMMKTPSVFVVLKQGLDAKNDHGIDVHLVTASADLAQEYLDSGEQIVDPVPMPPGLIGTIRDFADAHYRETEFKKRKRDKKRVDLVEDGIGDPRIRQTADVYRAPVRQKPKANQ
jgi:hypothetical protein